MRVDGHDLHDLNDAALQELLGRTAATSSNPKLVAAIRAEQISRHDRAAIEAAASAWTESEAEKQAKKRAFQIKQRNSDEAFSALAAVTTLISVEKEAIRKFIEAKKARKLAQDKAMESLTRALQKAPDGDSYFIGMDDALYRLLTHHGLRGGLREVSEPCLCAAGEQILGNFRGQLRIHANKHGLTLPKGAE